MSVLVLAFVLTCLPFWTFWAYMNFCPIINKGKEEVGSIKLISKKNKTRLEVRRILQYNFQFQVCQAEDVDYSTLTIILQSLSYMNSFINPILYTAFNREYRNAFSEMLLRCKFC